LFQYQALVWNHAATQRLLLYGGQVVAGDLVVADRSEIRQVQVVMAGEEAQFRMAQVVLPLPGWNVMYPQNAVAQVYEQMLAQDSIEFKKKQKGDDGDNGEAECSAKGSYRFLLAQSHEPVQCHKMNGSDSDYHLTFDLGPGCYATMFLRELLRTKRGSGNSGTFPTTTATTTKDTLAPC
jgi:tRNA pseudouridine13 synthase